MKMGYFAGIALNVKLPDNYERLRLVGTAGT